jgi:serine/threonine protein kinase
MNQASESKGKISKLSLTTDSDAEWAKLAIIRNAISGYPDLEKYFILAYKEPCKPDFKHDDYTDYNKICTTISLKSDLRIIQSTNGGPTLLDLSTTCTLLFIPFLNAMIELLQNGIVPLNNLGVVHRDIKHDNVVCSTTSGNYEIRLIDWDRAANIRDSHDEISTREQHLTIMLNQPIAYAFNSASTKRIIQRTDANLDALQKSVQKSQVINVNNAATYATGSNVVLVQPQITAILNKFYNADTKNFNWNEYANLLTRNYDVYGWLALINFCMQKRQTMFSDAATYVYYGEPMKAFLRHYMYTPEVLAEPYNTAEMITRLNGIRQSPLTPTALPRC